MVHLEDATIETLIDLPTMTDRLEEAWLDLAKGEASTTLRVRTGVDKLLASAMAAALPNRGVAGGKLYIHHPNGFDFVVVLFSADGGVLATLDANALTAVRTAAASAVAMRHLAPAGAHIGAVLGTGLQSTWHAAALAQETGLDELRLWGRTPQRVAELSAWCSDHDIPRTVVADANDAVDGADVVCTVTASYTPLFDGARLAEQALVCAVGATKPDRRELDQATVARASVIVADGVDGAKNEAGDLIQAGEAVDWSRVIDMKDIVAGTADLPSQPRGIVLFESQGIALQDMAAAALAYERWSER